MFNKGEINMTLYAISYVMSWSSWSSYRKKKKMRASGCLNISILRSQHFFATEAIAYVCREENM